MDHNFLLYLSTRSWTKPIKEILSDVVLSCYYDLNTLWILKTCTIFDREKFLGIHRIRNCIWLFWMFWLSFVITFSNFSWFEWFSLFLMILVNWYEKWYENWHENWFRKLIQKIDMIFDLDNLIPIFWSR